MNKQISDNEIVALWGQFERPSDGDRFQHYKGDEYEIITTGFLEDSLTPCVVYRSLETSIVWVRSAEDFLAIITLKDGIRQPRFRSV